MSLKALIELSKIKLKDSQGREYRSKKIIGADKGHWLVEYCYEMPGGYSYEREWQRMTDEEMVKCQCFADDYEGQGF